jgi:hypothetical protein
MLPTLNSTVGFIANMSRLIGVSLEHLLTQMFCLRNMLRFLVLQTGPIRMIATAFVASNSPRRISTDYQVGCRLQFLPSTEKVRVVRAHKSRARPSSLQDTTMSIRDEAFLPNVEEGTFDDDKLTGSEEDGMPKGIEPDYSEAQVDEMVEMYERGELEIVASDETK